MNRIIKFRAWHTENMDMLKNEHQGFEGDVFKWLHEGQPIIIMQFTGLKDKNGVEIYELMELDGMYRVVYDRCSYVLQDISTGDIFGLLDNSMRKANEREITREYSPV